MESSLVDDILDDCSQIRILVVGAARGKAQLIREIFGVNRVTRYPIDYSRDEEIYSKENEYFVAHVFDDWKGVVDVLKRRRKGDPDEVIHCIWHYIDAQDAAALAHGETPEQTCPEQVRGFGIPVISFFGRFDNVVTRSTQIGNKRRMGQELSSVDREDAAQIRKTTEAINLFLMQYPNTVALASKAPSSKLAFLDLVLSSLKDNPQAQMLFIIAQRLNPSLKFETSMSLAIKQFLLGTVSTASPLPIPFAGLIGSSAASYLIKQDIMRVWNIYDPDYLCSGARGQSSLMDTLLGLPEMGVKRLVYMLPVIAQINGIWETPRMARALGGLMIDLMLLMERAFLATMGGVADGLSPARTPARLFRHVDGTPGTPSRSQNSLQSGVKSPLSTEVARSQTTTTPNKSEFALINLDEDEKAPPTPARPSTATRVAPPKPARPVTPAMAQGTKSTLTPLLPRPYKAETPRSVVKQTPVRVHTGPQVLELSTPSKIVDTQIRPSSLPLTARMLEGIMSEYKPIQEAVKEELVEFFDQEGQGLARSFQKDTVRSKLDEIVRKWRVSEVVGAY